MMGKEWISSSVEPAGLTWSTSGSSFTIGKDGIVGYDGVWTGKVSDFVTIKTDTKTSEEKLNTLIRAVSNLIKDNEELKANNAFLLDKVKQLERANLDRAAEVAKACIRMDKIDESIYEARRELINIIDEKIDKA